MLSVQSLVSRVNQTTESLSPSVSESSRGSAIWAANRVDCPSPDSAIDVKTNSSAENTENEEQNSQSGPTSSCQMVRNSSSSEREPAIPIVPEAAQSEPLKEEPDSGGGDPDDWNTCNAPHFDIYEGFDNYDDLSDDHIRDLADSFIDTVLLNKLDKPNRKLLYQKLIEMKKTNKERRSMAVRELLSSQRIHPQITDIPQEIRKPRVDIREMFKFKKENSKIETLQKTTAINGDQIEDRAQSPESFTPALNPWTINELTAGTSGERSPEPTKPSGQCSSSQPTEEVADVPKVDACCNNCWSELKLTPENIKRMTVFCGKCSGIKFGGYFECQQCQLYGYFAMNQIEQHLKKHFLK